MQLQRRSVERRKNRWHQNRDRKYDDAFFETVCGRSRRRCTKGSKRPRLPKQTTGGIRASGICHYGKLKKVYSVWICIKPPERKQNTITRYRLREENLVGTVKAKRALRPDSDCDGEPRQQGRQSGICQYRLTYKKDAFMKYAKTFRNDILRNVLPSENKT